jgi:hypothetical protein
MDEREDDRDTAPGPGPGNKPPACPKCGGESRGLPDGSEVAHAMAPMRVPGPPAVLTLLSALNAGDLRRWKCNVCGNVFTAAAPA